MLSTAARLAGLFGRSPAFGVAAPAGLPVGIGARGAPGLVWDGGLGAVPALAGCLGYPPLFLGKAPVVFSTLGIPFPGLIVLLVALVLVVHRPYRCSLRGAIAAHRPYRCSLRGAIAAKLVRAAIWLRRTAGYGYLVCPGLW